MWDNGISFLYVTGECRYWVREGDSWRETRTGQLSSDEAVELVQALHFEELSDGYGSWGASQGYSDPPSLIMFDSVDEATCVGDCPSAPEALRAAAADYRNVLSALWDSGFAVDGGVRFMAVRIDPEMMSQYSSVHFQSWPLDQSLFDMSVSITEANRLPLGSGVLIDDGVGSLRDLRTSFFGSYEKDVYGSMFFEDDGGTGYQFYMRDTLPMENDAGLVRPSFYEAP